MTSKDNQKGQISMKGIIKSLDKTYEYHGEHINVEVNGWAIAILVVAGIGWLV